MLAYALPWNFSQLSKTTCDQHFPDQEPSKQPVMNNTSSRSLLSSASFSCDTPVLVPPATSLLWLPVYRRFFSVLFSHLGSFMLCCFILRAVGGGWILTEVRSASCYCILLKLLRARGSQEKAIKPWDCFFCSDGKKNSKCWVTKRVKFGSKEWRIGCGSSYSSGNFLRISITVSDLTWVFMRNNLIKGKKQRCFKLKPEGSE